MKNRCLSIALALAVLTFLAGCPPSGSPGANQFTFALSEFPENGGTFQVELQSFDSSGNFLDASDMGSADADSVITKTVTIPRKAASVGVYLCSTLSADPVWFMWAELAHVADRTVTMRFWADYSAYLSQGSIAYGLNSREARFIVDGQTFDFNYSDAPYYILKDDAAQGRSFQVTLENVRASSSVRAAHSVLSCNQGTWTRVVDTGTTGTIVNWDSTAMYLVVVPADYRVDTESRLTVSDASEQVSKWAAQTFSFVGVAPADNGASLIFAVAADMSLKKWDVGTGRVTTVATFTDPPVALTNDGGVIFVGAGTHLYTYDPATDITALRQSFAGGLLGIYPAGDYLLVDDSSGAWSTFSLVRKSDYTVTSQKTWVNYSYTSVFIPSQSRVYLLRDGTVPNDICYQDIDFAAESLGAYGDSPYHGDYPFCAPLLRFGTDLALVSGGHIFDVTDTGSASRIKWRQSLGTTFADLLFLPDRILCLRGDRLSSLDLNSPYSEISALPAFTGEAGRRLFDTPAGILVISVMAQTGRIVVRQYSCADLGPVSKASLVPQGKSTFLDPKVAAPAFLK